MYGIFQLTYGYYYGPGHGFIIRTKKVFEHLSHGHIVATIPPASRVSASGIGSHFQRFFVHFQGFNTVESDPSANGTTRPLVIDTL
jgi:hypothetical protein